MLVASYAPTVSWADFVPESDWRTRRQRERSLPPEAEAEPAPRAPSPCEERRKAEGHLGPGAYGNYSEKLVKKTLIVPKFSTLKRFHEPERPLTPPEQFMADPKPKRLLTPPQSPPRRPLEREEPWRPIRPLRPARLKLGRSSSSPTVLAGDSAHAETGGAQLLTQRRELAAFSDSLAGSRVAYPAGGAATVPSLKVTGRRDHSLTILSADPSSQKFLRSRDAIKHPSGRQKLEMTEADKQAAAAMNLDGLEPSAHSLVDPRLRGGSKSRSDSKSRTGSKSRSGSKTRSGSKAHR